MAETERLIDKINWGYISATIKTQNNEILVFTLRPPTPEERGKSAITYDREYKRCIHMGLSSEVDAITDFIITEQWDPEIDIQIEGLHKDIHNIRRGLIDFVFNRTKLEQSRSLLRRAEKALMDRLSKRHVLLQNTAEASATIAQQRYLISVVAQTKTGEPFWATEKDFEKFDDIGVVVQLCELFFTQSKLPTKLIRELARSQQWRVYWEVAKHTSDLFENSITSWSNNQRELAYWSSIYDSVYEAYERPNKEIILDDDLLDSWFIKQGEKVVNNKNNDTTSIKPGSNEVFVMADKEGAKRVYDMNDPTSRTRIKARQKFLQKHGDTKEQNLPDSQREIKQQLMNMRSQKAKDISRR